MDQLIKNTFITLTKLFINYRFESSIKKTLEYQNSETWEFYSAKGPGDARGEKKVDFFYFVI